MKRVLISLILLIATGLVITFGFNQEPVSRLQGKPRLVPDEIIVKFDQSVTDAKKNQIKGKYGLSGEKYSYKKGEFVVYKHQDPATVLSQLKNEPAVVYAEQNAYTYACMFPNDPLYIYQWNMNRINVLAAWDLSTGSGAVVAVLDTGVKQSLEDLAWTNFMPGWDFVNNDDDPTDDNGHGSHLCGTVAQSTNNSIGVVGIAFNCTVMPVKVLDQYGSGTYADVADGIYYAVANGAHVINLSLGGYSSSTALEDAVNDAWNNGVLLICSAGGGSSSTPMYPAAYTNSMAVSATNYLDQLAGYSNYGSWIDISAPGGDAIDYNGDGFPEAILQNTLGPSGEGNYYYSGTSMATAHVSGTAALVKACKPFFKSDVIRHILEGTAFDLGEPGWDPYFGYGRVDAENAVQTAMAYPLCLRVYDISMNVFKKGGKYWATAVITIVDTSNYTNRIPDAAVHVTWSGVVSGTDSGVTGPDGTVTFVSPQSKSRGPFVITVDYVEHASIPYCPGFNNETSDSISY